MVNFVESAANPKVQEELIEEVKPNKSTFISYFRDVLSLISISFLLYFLLCLLVPSIDLE
jgi:hypothetical protein